MLPERERYARHALGERLAEQSLERVVDGFTGGAEEATEEGGRVARGAIDSRESLRGGGALRGRTLRHGGVGAALDGAGKRWRAHCGRRATILQRGYDRA